MAFKVPEHLRVKTGKMASNSSYGNNGAFIFECKKFTYYFIASDALGWEHVSISLSNNRTPTWREMCMAKDLFWDEEDAVVQYHPAKSNYINVHPHVLHLWRPIGVEFPMPNALMV